MALMPSLLHEGLLELIRDRPRFVADLLRELLHVEIPPFTEARLTEGAFTQPLPAEYRADAVVLLIDERPVFGCIVEAQLAEDAKTVFTWPLYTVSARARYECPFVLVVVSPHERVASWASRPIALGGGQSFQPLVLGPAGIPLITDPIAAIAEPELAVLSALAHARKDSDDSLPVTLAALAGIASMAAEQQVLYFHVLRTSVGALARKAFEMLPYERLEKYLTEDERARMNDAVERSLAEGRNQGLAEGRSQGLVSALVKALEGRGLAVSSELRALLAARSDDELLAMIARSGVVAHADDLLT